ncbi:MAG: penicillin acylase [Calditrichaeota bacterium]|nr:MAG: penicillin acylase [Calditrichota bacterium]
MKKIILALIFTFYFPGYTPLQACSVVYFVDKKSGKIYVANNEDFWYDTKAIIQIMPKSKKKLARLWYGWDDFAQGGVNEAGLFFDGAVTPEQNMPDGFHKPKGNLGDDLLAHCATVQQAIDFFEEKKVALTNAHIMFGDSSGNSAIVEWIDGERKIIYQSGNYQIMTNFLLSDTTRGNYPCYRYNLIEKAIGDLNKSAPEISLREVGNTVAGAVQVPREVENGKIGGTLYSSFINISDMEFILVFKLDNTKITKLDLNEEFARKKKRKIKLR